LPKLIGLLTPGGKIPAVRSSEIENILSPPVAPRTAEPFIPRAASAARVEQVRPRHIEVIHDEPHMMRWLWPLLGALAILGLGSYLLSSGNRAPVTPAVVQAPAVPPAPATPTLPPRLTLSNDDGVIHYTGSVHDEETRTSIINSLKAVFGADKIQGVSVYDDAGHLVFQYMRGVSFPVSKQELLRLARSHNAGSSLLHSIEGLAERSYNNIDDVLRSIGLSMTH
jgi:hypothetical protein